MHFPKCCSGEPAEYRLMHGPIKILTEHSGGSAARCAERLCLSGGVPLLLFLAAMPPRSAQRTPVDSTGANRAAPVDRDGHPILNVGAPTCQDIDATGAFV